MIDCRLPRREPPAEVVALAAHRRRRDSLVIATLERIELTEQERLTAVIVRAGNPASEIAMIGRPPMTLGQLAACVNVLTGSTATPEQKRAAAEVLIWSTHRPHKCMAAPFLLSNEV